MEWQQLEYFRVIAKHEHFRKSAEELNISQPALSRSIAKLEEELGVPLFDRTGRSVELNNFGRHFLKRVEHALNEISIGIEEINHLKNPYTGTLSLAFLPALGITLLPDIISHFNKLYPDVDIQLFQSKTTENIKQLLSREVDLCLIGPIHHHPKIEWHPLLKEELFVYVPADHPLAKKKSLYLSEIRDDPFIGFKTGLGMREITDHLFEEAGFAPTIKFEGEDVSTLAGLVSSGLGVTIIPAFYGISSNKVKQLSISEPKSFREIGVAWLKGTALSPSAALFRSYVIERCTS